MHAGRPILAIAVTTAALTGCSITGAPVSMQAMAPAGADTALRCATRQLMSLGYAIAAADGKIGFVWGERHGPRNRRDVLTATVFTDPASGASSLRVTASLRSRTRTGSPTESGSADADNILAECAEQTASGSQGAASG